jgi:hypothetical protein
VAFGSGQIGLGRDQFPSEGFGQDRLRQRVLPYSRHNYPIFDYICQREQTSDAPNDFALFSHRGSWYAHTANVVEVKVRPRDVSFCLINVGLRPWRQQVVHQKLVYETGVHGPD